MVSPSEIESTRDRLVWGKGKNAFSLKDKLRHIKIIRAYLNETQFESNSIKPAVVRSPLPTGVRGTLM